MTIKKLRFLFSFSMSHQKLNNWKHHEISGTLQLHIDAMSDNYNSTFHFGIN